MIKNISNNEHQITYTWFTLNDFTYVIYHKNSNLLTIDNLKKKDSICVYFHINHVDEKTYIFNIKDKIITNKYHIASKFY